MKLKKEQLLLYAVTDRALFGGRTAEEAVREALEGGVTCVQLREKHLPEEALIAEAVRLKALCAQYGVPLIVNDNWRAAIAAGADGVHVGITDASVSEIRAAAPQGFLIGATAKTPAQAVAAEAAGADYLGVGAVFPSPTKPDALRITPEQLAAICGSVKIPAVAIGGITAENLETLRGSGIAGIAVVSAVFGAADIRQAASALHQAAAALCG